MHYVNHVNPYFNLTCMKRSFLYLATLVASLLLLGSCNQEEVPAAKPLLTEADKGRLRDLESIGFKNDATDAEYQAFKASFFKLNVPELDYFNDLVAERSIAYAKQHLPAEQREPEIKLLELSRVQRKKMNALSMRNFGKTYMHLTTEQFERTAREAGMAWESSEAKVIPTARTAANPGCNWVWFCNLSLNYSDSGANSGHLFDRGTFWSVYDAFTQEPDCNYGWQAQCTLQSSHRTITSTLPYARLMFTAARPGGFGGGPFSSQTPNAEIRRLLLGSARVTTVWGMGAQFLGETLRLLFQ